MFLQTVEVILRSYQLLKIYKKKFQKGSYSILLEYVRIVNGGRQ